MVGVKSVRASVVVGRDDELEALRSAIRGAQAAGSSCIVLVGEGGVGKTRLLSEAAALGRRAGVAVLAGRAPIVTPAPFSVFTAALRSWLRGHTGAVAPMGAFDRGLRLVLPEWPQVEREIELDGPQLHLLALEGIVRLISVIALDNDGALVLLDDLHASDAGSIDAMRHLVQAAIPGVSVVAAMRPTESPLADAMVRALHQDGHAELIPVDALTPRAVAALVAALLDAHPPDLLVADIVRRTDGVPLLVEEVVLAHVRAGTVKVEASATVWHEGAATVPRTIRELTAARMEALEANHRAVIVAGAVVGDFDPGLMVAVAQADDATVGEALTAGVKSGLLEASGGVMAFRHAILRDAVLDSTVPHVVDTMHRRAAAALEPDDAEDARDAGRLERRANHLHAVGADDEAALALLAAATIHLARHASLPAAESARAAVELARVSSVRESAADVLADALSVQGRWTEALEIDRSTTAEHGRAPLREERMARCALEVGRPDLAEEILADARAHGLLSAPMRITAGRAALVRGDAGTALDIASAVASASVGTTDDGLRFEALDLEGRAHDFLGDRDAARAAWETQAREARVARRTPAQLRAVIQLGKVELFAGEAPNRLFEAVTLAQEAGALVELGWAQENLAIALGIQGDIPASAALLADAVATCRALHLDQLAYLLVSQAAIASFSTDEGVEELLREAEALMDTSDLRLHSVGIRADVELRAGRYQEALGWLDAARDILHALPGVVPSDAICWRAVALTALHRDDEAAAALEEAREMPDLARWYGRPVVLACGIALLAGDEEAFERALRSAPASMPLDLALMRVIGAEVIAGTRSVQWLRDALDAWEAVGAPLAADRARRLLRACGPLLPFPMSLPPRVSPPAKRTCSDWWARGCRTPRSRSVSTSRCARSRRTSPRSCPSCTLATGPPWRPWRRVRSLRTRGVTDVEIERRADDHDRRAKEAPMSDTAVLDPAEVEQFAGQLMAIYTGTMLNYMIDVGHRTGLFSAAAEGAATSQELADRAGLTERYVREWLAAMVTARIFDYDPATGKYTIPAAHVAVLTDAGMNLAPMAALGTHLGKHVHQVARAFREGGGVPYAEYRPEFTDVMDGISRVFYDAGLIDLYLPLIPGLRERLDHGIRVADVACGTGHALVLLAREFPTSTFVGFDLDDGAIGRARAEAAGAQLTNVTFEVCDAARLRVQEPFDLIFVFDAVHDQVDPDAVLRAIRGALARGGVFFMKEPHGADALEDNMANPMAPLLYSVSTLHCMTVSLAHGGAGIGTMFGEQLALRMLADAGFTSVDVQPAPGDPGDAVYVAR
jgi:SAM-dependent methyltransferase